ncbi:MAG: GNAT family N-acetyltransferase [Chloroflexi bacterium]|nr:GNAT family N-acetyltransferase [Chloroflexota bacterium]
MNDPIRTANAFLTSFSHTFQVTYATKSVDLAPLRGVDYRGTGYTPTDLEFGVIDTAPEEALYVLQTAIGAEELKVTLNVFHEEEEPVQDLFGPYQEFGFEMLYTSPVLKVDLPAPFEVAPVDIRMVTRTEDVAFANATLAEDDGRLAESVLVSSTVRDLITVMDEQVVASTEITLAADSMGYISKMYTLPDYRRRGIAAALLNRAHEEMLGAGRSASILAPSYMARNYYQRFGYAPAVYFSVLTRNFG